MAIYYIKSRRTSPILYDTVEAETRDDAIHMMIVACPPGDQIEVLQAELTPYTEMEGMTGLTGMPGASGPSGAAMAAKPTRAQLNDMTKEELLALAEKQGVEVQHHWTKADIIDAIVKHK